MIESVKSLLLPAAALAAPGGRGVRPRAARRDGEHAPGGLHPHGPGQRHPDLADAVRPRPAAVVVPADHADGDQHRRADRWLGDRRVAVRPARHRPAGRRLGDQPRLRDAPGRRRPGHRRLRRRQLPRRPRLLRARSEGAPCGAEVVATEVVLTPNDRRRRRPRPRRPSPPSLRPRLWLAARLAGAGRPPRRRSPTCSRCPIRWRSTRTPGAPARHATTGSAPISSAATSCPASPTAPGSRSSSASGRRSSPASSASMLGLLAGYRRRATSTLIMGAMDILLSVPALILVIVLTTFLGAGHRQRHPGHLDPRRAGVRPRGESADDELLRAGVRQGGPRARRHEAPDHVPRDRAQHRRRRSPPTRSSRPPWPSSSRAASASSASASRPRCRRGAA